MQAAWMSQTAVSCHKTIWHNNLEDLNVKNG